MQYLIDEFLRYFPEAYIEVVTYDDGTAVGVDGEAIEVTVKAEQDSDPDYTFVMAIGSDDPWYVFTDGDLTITIPFEDAS